MPKFEIKSQVVPSEIPTILSLEEEELGGNGIYLTASKSDVLENYNFVVARIDSEGKLRLVGCLPVGLGLAVDESGTIQLASN